MASSMRDLWNKINDARKSVTDLPRQGLQAAMDKENELEHSALQKGVDFAQEHGVISSDTGQGIMDAHQVVEGMKSSYANMVGGSAKILMGDSAGACKDMGDGLKGMVDGENQLEHQAVQAGVDFAQDHGV